MLFPYKKFFGFWILMFGFFSAAGCGQIPSSSAPTAGSSVTPTPSAAEIAILETKGTAGYLQLNINGLATPSHVEVATIAFYKIVVERDGFAPIEQTLSKEANGLQIANLPTGKIRRIRLLALNARGQVLREGVTENVEISPGREIRLEIVLQAVPVFLNVADGDSISNQRLFFRLFSDPGHRLAVETDRALTDALSGESQMATDANGEAAFYSADFPAGDYFFTLRDLETQKFSTVAVHLWSGEKIRAAPLFAGSFAKAEPASRLGQSAVRRSDSIKAAGEWLANIARRLWEKR